MDKKYSISIATVALMLAFAGIAFGTQQYIENITCKDCIFDNATFINTTGINGTTIYNNETNNGTFDKIYVNEILKNNTQLINISDNIRLNKSPYFIYSKNNKNYIESIDGGFTPALEFHSADGADYGDLIISPAYSQLSWDSKGLYIDPTTFSLVGVPLTTTQEKYLCIEDQTPYNIFYKDSPCKTINYTEILNINTTNNLLFWSDDNRGTALVNNGLNLPAANTLFDLAFNGTKRMLSNNEVGSKILCETNFRKTTSSTSLNINVSIRNGSNVLCYVNTSSNAVGNYYNRGNYIPINTSWFGGFKTFEVFTQGGNGADDFIFSYIGVKYN